MEALSKNNVTLRLLIPIVAGCMGCLVSYHAIQNSKVLKYLATLGIALLCFYWTFRRYMNIPNVYFDEYFLVLKSKKQERKISILNVLKVKLTLSDMRVLGNQFYEYRIEFKNEDNKREAINLFISNMNPSLWDFQDLVRQKARHAVIENHANSWDH